MFGMNDPSKPVTLESLMAMLQPPQTPVQPPANGQPTQPGGSVWGMMHPDAAPGTAPNSLSGLFGGGPGGGGKGGAK